MNSTRRSNRERFSSVGRRCREGWGSDNLGGSKVALREEYRSGRRPRAWALCRGACGASPNLDTMAACFFVILTPRQQQGTLTSQGLIPATILTGFLGSGKTTLLKRVLSEAHGQKIAVIENEFGSENIDNEILVHDSREQIIQLNNGCVCCSIREDLRTTLSDLAEKKRKGELDFDRVVIETTGLADPGPVAPTFFMDDEIAEAYLLDSILTLVDAKHADAQLDTRQEARRQVGFADQIFISKSDLVEAGEVEDLIHRLKHMNPRAPQRQVHFGEVPIAEVFNLRGFNLNAKLDIDPEFLNAENARRAAWAGPRPRSRTWRALRAPAPPSPRRRCEVLRLPRRSTPESSQAGGLLGAIVQVYGPKMLRYKGVLHLKGSERKVIFQGVHQLMGSDLGPKWAPGEKKTSKMVFIGIDLPKDILLQGLEQCVS